MSGARPDWVLEMALEPARIRIVTLEFLLAESRWWADKTRHNLAYLASITHQRKPLGAFKFPWEVTS